MAVIPGFKNLQEFSKHPAIQEILADEVTHEWAKNNVSVGLRFQIYDTMLSDITTDVAQENLTLLKKRVDNFMQPSIFFKYGAGYHSVLVSHYQTDKNGRIILCTRDNNKPPILNRVCNYKIWINKNGKLEHSVHGELEHLKLVSFEDSNTVEQINSLRTHCQSKKDC